MEFIANYGREDENEEIKAPRKLKSYTAEFKLKVIKHAEDFSNKAASKKFGVDRSSVIGWIKQKKQLHQIKDSSPAGKFKKRLQGGRRPLAFKDLDEQLAVCQGKF